MISASIGSSSNVLIDSVQALWNNFGGLGIFSSNYVTVQNCACGGGNSAVGRIGGQQFINIGSWNRAKELGKLRVEGKEYEVQDGDVLEIRFNV